MKEPDPHEKFDPADGHIFRFKFSSRGSYSIVGDAQHYFEPVENLETEPVFMFEVQAWSLVEALRKAAEMPFNELVGREVKNEGT